jgi:hypothetical protein
MMINTGPAGTTDTGGISRVVGLKQIDPRNGLFKTAKTVLMFPFHIKVPTDHARAWCLIDDRTHLFQDILVG